MAELQANLNRCRAEGRRERKEARERDGEEEREIAAWFGQIQAVADSVMHAAGFHKHERQWRRKADMNTVATKESASRIPARPRPPARGRETEDLIKRASEGDPSCYAEVGALLADGERGRLITNLAGSPSTWLLRSILDRTAGENILRREATTQTLAEVQAELEGPNPTAIERLLAERVAYCWFLVNLFENTMFRTGLPIPEADSQQRKIDRAHGRFLSALRTLAQIRKLALPSLMVNIARNQQINTITGRADSG
jgi:hypothetical protein